MSFLLNMIHGRFTTIPPQEEDCTDKVVIITGGNGGIALEAARHFTQLSAAKVILACRSLEKGDHAKKDIEETSGKQNVVEVWHLDLASHDSIREFADRVNKLDRLDVFINNAGLLVFKRELIEGHESMLSINVISTALLTLLVLPALRQTSNRFNIIPHIVIVSSDAAFEGRLPVQEPNFIKALDEQPSVLEHYSKTKLVQLIFMTQLAKAIEASGKGYIVVNGVHPGFCSTPLFDNTPWPFNLIFKGLLALFGRTPEVGSRALLAGAFADESLNGKFMSNGAFHELPKIMQGDEGEEMCRKVWEELISILEEIEPGVTKKVRASFLKDHLMDAIQGSFVHRYEYPFAMDSRAAAAEAMRSAIEYWSQFVARCISQRLDTEKFENYVRLVHDQHPLPPALVADFFLRPQPSNDNSLDPRIPPYLQVLTRLGYVDAPSILKALYKYSSLHAYAQQPNANDGKETEKETEQSDDKEKDEQKQKVTRWKSSYWAEEVLFYGITKSVVEGKAIRDSKTALDMTRIISKLMVLFTTAFAADMLEQLHTAQVRDEMESSRAALVALLLRMCENDILVGAVSKPIAKDVRKEMSASLASFVPTLQLVPQITDKLEQFRTEILASSDPADKKKQATNAAMDELLDSAVGLDNFVVAEIPVSNTRAGLYIYLNAALIARPLLDDHALFSYMSNKYQGDIQSSAIDLILASFDILANAVFRNEGQKDAHLLRSFLINKVPILLYQLLPPGFPGTSAEFCITEALSHVDTSLFPTASLMFDESRNNNPYTESIREEFCAACVLHGLVQREHVERILGEISLSYEPSLQKHSKDKLVQDCLSDTEKIQGLVRELDKMDGNVGAVCQALVESLDVILLFEKLPNILEPLCQLLDNWRYEDDQEEYQLLDIGIASPDSWVAKIIGRGHIGRQCNELTQRENDHLNGWIHGLFDTEAGGLGDELMSSCPPQEFYLVVAPLFQSIVVAYTHGYLNDESLKGGIEYLVDTFLLPSLVPAIRFLADYLWIDQKEQKSIIKILQLILLPSSISGEASTMLSSVKNLIAKPLEHALRTYQRRDPKNQDIEPLLRTLKDSIPLSRRTGGTDLNELESWTVTPPTGLSSAIKLTIQGLVHWSIHPAMNSMPTSYTHRQILAALKIMGPKRVLHVILEEIRQHTEAGSASIVYDVAISLICAPDAAKDAPAVVDANGNMLPPVQRQRSLRDLLKVEAEGCRKLQKKDPALAEIVVRLHRRVEAQMIIPQPPGILQTAEMSLNLDGDTAALGDAMAAAASGVQGDNMSVDNLTLDVSMGGVPSDLGLGSANDGGSLDPSGDAAMFEGFDTQDMDNFDWDDIGNSFQ
ncbi:Mediator of RNA polymerase II transcription subunit 5 [Fusarium oxysporum f. sp. phaseoli]